MQKIDQSILDELARYDSATVQNAAILVRGYVGEEIDYSGPELRCMLPEFGTLVGYAVTAEASPLHERGDTTDWAEYYDLIAYTDVPTIAVLKDVDSPAGRGAILGDGMAYRHRALGCLGAIVDGSVRDVPGIRDAKFGVWATGRVPGHGPFNLIRHSLPVTIAGLHIQPGDILVCDGDGVTRVPLEIAAATADKAAEVRSKEAELHSLFASHSFSLEDYERWKRQ